MRPTPTCSTRWLCGIRSSTTRPRCARRWELAQANVPVWLHHEPLASRQYSPPSRGQHVLSCVASAAGVDSFRGGRQQVFAHRPGVRPQGQQRLARAQLEHGALHGAAHFVARLERHQRGHAARGVLIGAGAGSYVWRCGRGLMDLPSVYPVMSKILTARTLSRTVASTLAAVPC